MEDSLVVEEGILVKFPLVPFATCILPLQLLLQGSFHQVKVKQPHCRDTKRPNIMNYLGPPEAPDHLPLFPVCQNSETTVARTSKNKAKAISAKLLELIFKNKLEETGKTR